MRTQRKVKPLWIALTVLVLASLACSLFTDTSGVNNDQPTPVSPTSEPAQNTGGNNGLSQQERANLIAATVQIYGLFKDKNGDLVPGYVGSGTIISPDGLILTNAHVASPAAKGEPEYEPDALAVGLVEHEDKPAVFSYLAQVRAVDGFLDLAVIQIDSDLKGNSIDTSQLNLPFVALGNSDQIHVGDHINIFGFPAIGGETITFTTGNVSGFSSEEEVGDRAWIKTDATISGGNSGGLGADDNGHIIGVPTIAASGAAGANATDCRVIQDTNNDGQLDNSDTCIPIGGFINALRPVNLAMPLIQAAKTGKEYASPYGTISGGGSVSGSGNESFTDLQWVTIDKDGNPVDQVSSYPSGSSAIAVRFAFSGMTDGETWSEVWYQDGSEYASGSFEWQYGPDGHLTVYLQNQDGSDLADGQYKLELYGPNNDLLGEAEVTVGSGSSGNQQPSGSGKGVLLSGRVVDQDSQKGLNGALVVVLNPGVSVDDWVNNNYPDADIYAVTQTDMKGQFSLPVQLKRDVAYNIIIVLDGYQALVFEDQTFTANDPDELDVKIELVKQ